MKYSRLKMDWLNWIILCIIAIVREVRYYIFVLHWQAWWIPNTFVQCPLLGLKKIYTLLGIYIFNPSFWWTPTVLLNIHSLSKLWRIIVAVWEEYISYVQCSCSLQAISIGWLILLNCLKKLFSWQFNIEL